MSCSCHICPPCPFCEALYECNGCAEICHPDVEGQTLIMDMAFCDKCIDVQSKL